MLCRYVQHKKDMLFWREGLVDSNVMRRYDLKPEAAERHSPAVDRPVVQRHVCVSPLNNAVQEPVEQCVAHIGLVILHVTLHDDDTLARHANGLGKELVRVFCVVEHEVEEGRVHALFVERKSFSLIE